VQGVLLAMWGVTLELAPWLLLGTAVAGALHVLLPHGFIHRQLGGRFAVPKAVALGVPLPLCSCGVIPAGLSLRRDGASPGATVGFLISTPQTGVDSILVSGSFLGWPFALFKLASAAITGLVGGWIADGVAEPAARTQIDVASEIDSPRDRSFRGAVDHGVDVLRSIWRWIVFGVVASALIEVLVPDAFFESLAGRGVILPMLASLAVSLPLYVCATASVPIAAALVAGGLPGGAALVFLMAGPATNVATIGAIHRALGRRALAVYLSTIVLGSLGAGWLFDFLLTAEGVAPSHVHGNQTWWALASAAVLALLVAWFVAEDLRRLVAARFGDRSAPTVELAVSGMSCGNCVSKVEKELRTVDGVTGVSVSLDAGRAVVRGAVEEESLVRAVERLGFEVV
jgi:uncharacterized membrane protein YraQ (UPF0718 family)/copper chaperone CopZ